MPDNAPGLILKVVWMTHFVLSSWALFGQYLPAVYYYTHLGVLAFGFWAIVSNESADAALMFLGTLLFSILNDILCLALYEPRGYSTYERLNSYGLHEYRFALGMTITNLLLKPVSAFLILRIFKSRSSGTEFNPSIPGLGARGGFYDNMDTKQGPAGAYGAPAPPNPYAYQEPPTYQQAPVTETP